MAMKGGFVFQEFVGTSLCVGLNSD